MGQNSEQGPAARTDTDGGRFLPVAANTIGRRLTYKTLIAADAMED